MNVEVILALLIPFIIGLLVGAIIKKAFNLIILGVALVIVLIATGAISLTYKELYNKALTVLPKLWNGAQGWIGILPYSSIGFLLGLAIGLWRA